MAFTIPKAWVNGEKLACCCFGQGERWVSRSFANLGKGQDISYRFQCLCAKVAPGDHAFSGVLEHDLIGEPSRLVPKDSLCERQRGVDRGQAAFAAPLEGWQLGCEGVSV